jgi:hypothetical protein
MRPAHLVCLAGLSLWSAVASGNQAASAAALPEGLRTHVENERFGIVTSIRGLPLGVREALQVLFGSQTLDIAEPGAEFQRTGAAGETRLPSRRLAVAGCSSDHCLVYYERGGKAPAWQVALFHWTPAATKFEWGGTAGGGLKTLDDVRRAVLSGAVKSPNKVW